LKRSKEILITGGAGAIGSVLVRQLLPDHKITIVDNLSSGERANVESLDVELAVVDIRDLDKLASIFAEKTFDIVIHLAAHFANQNSVDFPATDLSVNLAGTLNLLELCRESRPRFVYASSSCVYGAKSGPLHESLPIDDLHTPYAITKYTGELYCRFYAHHYGIESIALRFFNNYGPFDPPGKYRNAVPNFVLKALRGEDIVITGTGDETRDFCYCERIGLSTS
jgi:nucleoside-diphosphate-sugar epimerase